MPDPLKSSFFVTSTSKKPAQDRIFNRTFLALWNNALTTSQMDRYAGGALPTEEDEARMLANRDVDDMASHRVEHMHAYSRHKIHRPSITAQLAKLAKDGSTASGMFQVIISHMHIGDFTEKVP